MVISGNQPLLRRVYARGCGRVGVGTYFESEDPFLDLGLLDLLFDDIDGVHRDHWEEYLLHEDGSRSLHQSHIQTERGTYSEENGFQDLPEGLFLKTLVTVPVPVIGHGLDLLGAAGETFRDEGVDVHVHKVEFPSEISEAVTAEECDYEGEVPDVGWFDDRVSGKGEYDRGEGCQE